MTEPTPLTAETPHCPRMTVSGAVDVSNARELSLAMEKAAAGGPLVLDLSTCTYLDSTGLSVFVKHERANRGRLAIVAPTTQRSLRLFEIAGLALTLTLFSTLAEAYAYFEGGRLSA